MKFQKYQKTYKNYMFIIYTDIIKILANIFHKIYGINKLSDKLLSRLDSKYKYKELIRIIIVSIIAIKGLLMVKKKKLNI